MKNFNKIFLILCITILLTGCGKSDKEKEKILYNSLNKAYTVIFSTEGAGLAVFANEKVEIDGVNWYMVATNNYKDVSILHNMASDVFTKEISIDYDKTIDTKYKNVDNKLYTTSQGGCKLPYILTDELTGEIKKDVKIEKIKGKKITFKYKNKSYTAKLVEDNYVFDNKIFTCEK